MKPALKVQCPYCGSRPGYDCMNEGGVVVRPHMARVRTAAITVRPSALAAISEAIATAGEHSREQRQQQDKLRAKMVKQCPCHGSPCEEAATGGRPCGPGVCVRMN